MGTLREHLNYHPRELGFGTSGRRGEVVHLTDLEIYINVSGEMKYLQSLAGEDGGIARGDEFFLARDLRPTSPAICRAVIRALADAGMRPVNLGRIPTPALAGYGWDRQRASIMVTGSHIPFDRNGYKLNTSRGELLKSHEAPIQEAVRAVRQRIYSQPYADSLFDERGTFREAGADPSEETGGGRAYLNRYREFFPGTPLQGKKIVVYQHSAVGRDLLVEMLQGLGAEAIPLGRSEEFVPIDTENIDAAQLARIQDLADTARREHGTIHAIVSTDGDSDRPLLLDCDPRSGSVRFFGGDLLGMIVAEFLQADSVVVPVSCNDAIDRGGLAGMLEPKTRIGSPYVIAGMEEARRRGRRAVCGWEANGGFLTATDIQRHGRTLSALPTRDAFLPIISVLVAAQEQSVRLSALFDRLPRRYSRAALLKNFPRAVGLSMVQRYARDDAATRAQLEEFFGPQAGFGSITRLDLTDGVRLIFSNGDVAHFRPSGNADELRIYAVADTQERADAIARMSVSEPDGILRRMERAGTRNREADAAKVE